MQLTNGYLQIDVTEQGGLMLTRLADGVCFVQDSAGTSQRIVSSDDKSIELECVASSMCVKMVVSLASDNPHAVDVRLEGEGAMPGNLELPCPWRTMAGDLVVLPYFEGVVFRAEEDALGKINTDAAFGSCVATLGVFGLMRPAAHACLFTGLGEMYDARLRTVRNDSGLLQSHVAWESVKGMFGYSRSIRYFFTETLGEFAREYREWRDGQGGCRTLAEKAARAPSVAKLAGAADVWLWDDNNMNRLYGRPETEGIPPRDVRRVAGEMLSRGMAHVLWNSFEGETPEDCAWLKSQGFIVGKYDIYRDVLPKTLVDVAIPYRRKRSVNTKYWPQIVRRMADGSYAQAWQIHGLDGEMHWQHAVCEIPALELTKLNVPPDVERVGYTSRFIDVQASGELQECYDPEHPATRRDSAQYIRAQMDFIEGLGLAGGVENGNECFVGYYHFAEGLMSPGLVRAYDSGRRMTTIYRGDEIPKVFYDSMLNPVCRLPLWELIYHDCVVNYWYWGDSSNCCPELMPRRDLFNALYGTPPLYSLTVSQWDELKDEIAQSYHRATVVASQTAFARMVDFQWLSDDGLIQKTCFANGVEVIVNFAQETRTANDVTLSGETALVIDSQGTRTLLGVGC